MHEGGANFDRMFNYSTSNFYAEANYGKLNFSEACQGNNSFVIAGVDPPDMHHSITTEIFNTL